MLEADDPVKVEPFYSIICISEVKSHKRGLVF